MRERLETPDREGQRGTGASAARGLVHVGGRQPAQAGGIRAPFEVSMLIEQPSATVTSCAVRPGAEPRLVELSALALEFSAVKCSRRSFACPNVRRPRSSRPCHPERARPPGAPKLGARKLAIPSIAKKAFSFSVPAPSSSICPHTFCCNKSQRLQQPRVKLRGSIRLQVANSFVPGDAFACYSWYRGTWFQVPLASDWLKIGAWVAPGWPRPSLPDPRPAQRPPAASARAAVRSDRVLVGGPDCSQACAHRHMRSAALTAWCRCVRSGRLREQGARADCRERWGQRGDASSLCRRWRSLPQLPSLASIPPLTPGPPLRFLPQAAGAGLCVWKGLAASPAC